MKQESSKKKITKPIVEIRRLEVIGDTIFQNPQNLKLKTNQNNLRIEFSLSNIREARQFTFKHKILESTVDWQTSKSNSVDYLSLGPGNYTFRVKARVSGSQWSDPVDLYFTVKTPFWYKWTFWTGIILGIVAITTIMAYTRIKKIRAKERHKRETATRINQLKQQALLASMNPHFIFNSLNSIQHFFSKHKDPEAIDFVAEFGQLVRQNMEFSSREEVRLIDEADYLKRYLALEALRFDHPLEYSITIDPKIENTAVLIPSMLIQPFVENALWHGLVPNVKQGQVKVHFFQKGNFLYVTVEDNGIGLEHHKSKEQTSGHTSRGISLIKERMKLLSPENELHLQEVLNVNGSVKGTRVTLKLQINPTPIQSYSIH